MTNPTRHYPSTICNHDYFATNKQIVPRDTTCYQVCARTAKTHAIPHRDRFRSKRKFQVGAETLTNYTPVPLYLSHKVLDKELLGLQWPKYNAISSN